eukprot:1763720-Amphidinium_carterae.1
MSCLSRSEYVCTHASCSWLQRGLNCRATITCFAGFMICSRRGVRASDASSFLLGIARGKDLPQSQTEGFS